MKNDSTLSLETLAAAASAVFENSESDSDGNSQKNLNSGRTGNITFDGTTVLCQVCGDKASGFHYGVHACEGCKGFFRRSIQQKIQYRPCTKNQQCSVLRINRNRCQYCRLKKCIAVGMSRDAVRFGRVPKREKAKILAEMQRANAQSQVSLISAELENEQSWISNIITAHMETCEFTRDKALPLIQRYRQLDLSRPVSNVACPLNPLPSSGENTQEELSEKYSPAIRGVVNFAKCIPGFHILPQEDQVTLLKAGVFEVLLLRLTILFDTDQKSLLLLSGSIYRRDGCPMQTSNSNGNGHGTGNGNGTACQGRFLVDSLFDFVDRFNSLGLTDADISMFCAVVLISPDRPGLRNPELVEKIHDRLKQALRNILQINHPTEPSLFGQLVLKIPDLRTLNTLHAEKLLAFKMDPQEKFRFGKESVESSANGSCRSAESSYSAASSRSVRSPMSDASSSDAINLKNHKIKGLAAESSQWSTVCRASESKDDSSNISSTPPMNGSKNPNLHLEPQRIQALNLSSSSNGGGSIGKPFDQTSAHTQQHSVRVINWRPAKECPSLDSGKGSASSGCSDHGHSDNESKPNPINGNLKNHLESMDRNKNSDGTHHKSVDMPTLKRALLAPPLTSFASDMSQANGNISSVRDRHMCVASLLEKQSISGGIPSINNFQLNQQQQQQTMGNWGFGTASNALAAQAFFLNNRALTQQQRFDHQPQQQLTLESSTTPIQQLLNAAAVAAVTGATSHINTPILQSPLNFPPMRNGESQIFAKNPSPIIRTVKGEGASPVQHYAGAIVSNGGCRSSPKRSLMEISSTSDAMDGDDEQPLNLSKKQAVGSPNSDSLMNNGRSSAFDINPVSGLSCR